MIGYVGAPGAFGLARGMARCAGVNLTEAVVEGWLSRGELAEMVDRCIGCAHGGECLVWLARSVEDQPIPAFCPNHDALEALRAEG